MHLTFHAGDLDSADVCALLAWHFDQMRTTSPPEACHVLPANALADPSIVFWSARNDGNLAGIGALKRLGHDHAEVKSMRTVPAYLGTGVGRAILRHIIDEARRRGYRRLSLETGSAASFAAAIRLYETEGFVSAGPFANYVETPFTRFFTREI
jgi:putative acetyltransferase